MPWEWASGEALPAVASLAAHYEVSGAADDGLIEIVPQWGTFRT